jgi:hypothetical protein
MLSHILQDHLFTPVGDLSFQHGKENKKLGHHNLHYHITEIDSRLEGGVNSAKLKFTKLITTTSRVSVRNKDKSERESAKQIASE